MKKAITEAKVQRMRNLVTGKYKNKTATQIGYTKTKTSYEEGDVWEERGKTWTIKNGLRQNITKLDEVRKIIKTPLCCPKCGNRMNKRLDKKFYKLRKQCFDCVVAFEHELKMKGEYKQYERNIISSKLESMYKNVETALNEGVDQMLNKEYITESGHKEDWSGGLSKEQYQTLVNAELDKLRSKIDGYKNNGKID